MTSPASFSTYGGECSKHPESNLKTTNNVYWKSSTADGRRGITVTFERTVTISHFFGYFHILIKIYFNLTIFMEIKNIK